MITLSADNRSLLAGAPYTYLADNHSSGVAALSVVNTVNLAVDQFVLVGLFGDPSSELFRIGSIDSAAQTVAIHTLAGAGASTLFAHSESTRVTVLAYDQVRFFWTAATGTITDENPVFNTSNPLSDWLDIDPTSWYTSYNDESQSTGFGWFLFQNSATLDASQNSNAIPYTGFATNSVQYVFTDFMSLLNNKELKLVTNDDMLSWLNEANALVRNKLNLSNPEYTVSTPQAVTFIAGTSEYLLPSDFNDLVQIVNSTNGRVVPFISLRDAMQYKGNILKYYIRGRYIGFVPTPGLNEDTYATTSVTYTYRSKGSRLTGLDDLIDLPDNGFFILKDWMMYRACLKFQNPNAQIYYKGFNDGLNQMIVSSIHRDANLDSWGLEHSANV